MADIRINALATTATSPASDDYLALDGTTNGTRKMLGTQFVSSQTLTDNAIVRADGTAGQVQNSTITVSDTGVIAAASGTLTLTTPDIGAATGTSLSLTTTDGGYAAKLAGASGKFRVRGYTDSTNGALLDAYNTAEDTLIPLSLNGNGLRLNTLNNGAITTGTGLFTMGGNLTVSGTGTSTFGTTNTVTMAAGVLKSTVPASNAYVDVDGADSTNSGFRIFSGSAVKWHLASDGNTAGNLFSIGQSTGLTTYTPALSINHGTLAATLAGNLTVSGTGTSTVAGSFKSTNATGGIGYGTGAGGAVTQLTNRTTGVTLNTISGAITLVSAAGTATWQTFTVTNSAVAATDVVVVSQKSGTDLNMIAVTAVGAGSFNISFATTGGTTTEQPIFNFAVIKAVAA